MAITDRLSGLNIGAAVKPACVVATTGNVTLSGAQTVDGISVGSCERVLVKDQTDASENGIYLADSSTWIRSKDFDGSKDAIPGTFVRTNRGTLYTGKFWGFNSSSTATSIVIGTDDITVADITPTLAGASTFSEALLALGTASAWLSTSGLGIGTTIEHSWTAKQTFQGSSAESTPLEIIEVDDSTARGPIVTVYKQRSSAGVTNDLLGAWWFEGNSSTGARQRYSSVEASINGTSPDEGQMDFAVRIQGAMVDSFRVDSASSIPQAGAFWKDDSGAGEGPYTVARRRSDTPSSDDKIGGFASVGTNSAGNSLNYWKVVGVIDNPTTGTEAGHAVMSMMVGGTQSQICEFRPNGFYFDTSGPRLLFGSSSPENVVTAPIGSIFMRTDGSATSTIYQKASGAGSTGWLALT